MLDPYPARFRLGMGGGFYDVTLAFMRHRRSWRKPRLVGIAYECQLVESLPHDPGTCRSTRC
ncbi:MAG: 5-formyltetrahydrofolate cyclo-ligase [Thiobacillus sp.]